MKTPIAITLIVMGGLIVLAPALSDLIYQHHVVTLMARSDVTGVTLGGRMGELDRFGCWLSGSGMIGIAVFSSLRMPRREENASALTPHVA